MVLPCNGFPSRRRLSAACRIARSTNAVTLLVEHSHPTMGAGEGVDHERGVGKHPGTHRDVGEIGAFFGGALLAGVGVEVLAG